MKRFSIAARLWLPVVVLGLVVAVITAASSWRTVRSQHDANLAQEQQQARLELALRWAAEAQAQAVRDKALQSSDTALVDTLKPEAEAAAQRIAQLQQRLQSLVRGDDEEALLAQAGSSTQALAQFVELQEAQGAALRAEVGAQRLRTVGVVASVMTGIVLLLASFTWFTVRAVRGPLRDVVAVADRIAAGDLSAHIETQRADEIGDVQRALSRMTEGLRGLVGTVRQTADSLSIASQEIAHGNHDLSQRTEATASNLQQTASSMAQLTHTVSQSADAAAQANQLASSAAAVAQRGGQVVSQVVATMHDISASSRKISDIIGVIDGIAFQTNILALNAAVEAARAGDQGRGFAVVAGEVRTLAQRSAQAAKEIKALIGSSVDRVETGAQLVHDAGSTMSEIVASVQRVTDIIGEITAAASEQSGGIGQVNQAVSQLDQMTQQNAALVEQSAAAAESLKDQARQLAGMVAAFRLQDAAAIER